MSTLIDVLAGGLAMFGGICYLAAAMMVVNWSREKKIFAFLMGSGCLYAAVQIFMSL